MKGDSITNLVLFSISGQKLGLELEYVHEIINLVRIEPAIDTSPGILGTINYRGTVIPVIQLDRILNLPPVNITINSLIFILKVDELLLGFIAEEVDQIIYLPRRRLEPIPSHIHISEYIGKLIKYRSSIIYLLDVRKLSTDLFADKLHFEKDTTKGYIEVPSEILKLFTEEELRILNKRTEDLTLSLVSEPEDNVIFNYLIFSLRDGNYYALNTDNIVEVVNLPEIYYVPNQPPFIKGVILLREEIISVLNLVSFLVEGEASKRIEDRKDYFVIIIEAIGKKFGVAVYNIEQMCSIARNEIQSLNTVIGESRSSMIIGSFSLNERIVNIISPDEIVNLIDKYYRGENQNEKDS